MKISTLVLQFSLCVLMTANSLVAAQEDSDSPVDCFDEDIFVVSLSTCRTWCESKDFSYMGFSTSQTEDSQDLDNVECLCNATTSAAPDAPVDECCLCGSFGVRFHDRRTRRGSKPFDSVVACPGGADIV